MRFICRWGALCHEDSKMAIECLSWGVLFSQFACVYKNSRKQMQTGTMVVSQVLVRVPGADVS